MMDALRRTAQQDERRGITREDYARAEAGLRKAVAEGKISEEDVRARLNGMRRAMAEQGERQRGGERQRTTRGDKRAEYEGFERRIKAAIAEGKISRKEAGEKLEGFRRRMGMAGQAERGSKRITREDWEGIKKQFEGAVKSGDMTREEADAKYKEIRERLGQTVRGKDAKDKDDD